MCRSGGILSPGSLKDDVPASKDLTGMKSYLTTKAVGGLLQSWRQHSHEYDDHLGSLALPSSTGKMVRRTITGGRTSHLIRHGRKRGRTFSFDVLVGLV